MNADQLVDLLEKLGVERVQKRGGNLMALCPLHDERKPSWGISVTKDGHPFGCFSCKRTGTLLTLVAELRKVDHKKALAFIEKFGEYEQTDKAARILPWEKRIEKRSSPYLPTEYLGPFRFPYASKYLYRKYGIDGKTQKKCRLGFDPEQKRVIFPWCLKNRVIGVTGRAIDENNSIKVLPYYGFKKSQCVYLPSGFLRRGEAVVICEAETDALKVQQAGLNAVASGWSWFRRGQAEFLLEAMSRFGSMRCAYILPDPDDAGEGFVGEIVRELEDDLRLLLAAPQSKEKRPSRMKCSRIREAILRAKVCL